VASPDKIIGYFRTNNLKHLTVVVKINFTYLSFVKLAAARNSDVGVDFKCQVE
jgi:hypothetical protein